MSTKKKTTRTVKHIPLGNRVIIRQSNADTITDGGIIIPEMSQEQPNRGTVIAAGVECKEVKVGDTVEFGEYVGIEITVDGQECIIMKEIDIFLIIR